MKKNISKDLNDAYKAYYVLLIITFIITIINIPLTLVTDVSPISIPLFVAITIVQIIPLLILNKLNITKKVNFKKFVILFLVIVLVQLSTIIVGKTTEPEVDPETDPDISDFSEDDINIMPTGFNESLGDIYE